MKARYRELNFSAHRIKIKIEGFRIDRLLDKAMKKGLDLRNIRIISSLQAECWTTPDDLKELKRLAKSLYKITEDQSDWGLFSTSTCHKPIFFHQNYRSQRLQGDSRDVAEAVSQ